MFFNILAIIIPQSVSQILANKISLLWFGFRLEPVFTTTPAALKYNTQFKRCQIRLEGNHQGSFVHLNP